MHPGRDAMRDARRKNTAQSFQERPQAIRIIYVFRIDGAKTTQRMHKTIILCILFLFLCIKIKNITGLYLENMNKYLFMRKDSRKKAEQKTAMHPGRRRARNPCGVYPGTPQAIQNGARDVSSTNGIISTAEILRDVNGSGATRKT